MLIPLVISFSAQGQVSYQFLNYSLRTSNDWQRSGQSDSVRQSSFYPNIVSDLGSSATDYNGYLPVNRADSLFLKNRKYSERSWFHRKLLKEHFVVVDTGLLYLTIDPLFNFSAGSGKFSRYEGDGRFAENKGKVYTNTRGILVKGDLGTKLSFESYFYENQSRLPGYVSDFVDEYGVVPGQGRVKNFKGNAYDYAQSGGYVSYAPFRNFNIQAGHHKHFIGDGYRSFFLSDNSYNYPFVRFNMWFLKNKLNYSVMYASFQNLKRLPTPATSEAAFQRKAGSFHYLQYQVADWLRLNLFQGMIWKTMDTTGKSEIDYNMFNPVMFVNPAMYGLDSRQNAILGFGFKANAGRKLTLYGQYALDDNAMERFAVQGGFYYFIRKTLRLQLEFNHASPNTYQAPTALDHRNSYTHYNQALAHPLGTGFDEFILKLNYRLNRFLFETQLNLAGHNNKWPDYGNDVFASNYKTYSIPPRPTSYDRTISTNQSPFIFYTEIAYLINAATNAKIFINWTYRNSWANYSSVSGYLPPSTNNFVYFGLRTDLRNLYYDF